MKISKDLPQFKEEKALLIVSGEKEGKLFIVNNGEIKEVDSIKMVPQYSEREGYFERKGKGKFFGSGSVYEEKKKETRRVFIKKIGKSLEKAFQKEKPNEAYLFSSKHMMKNVKGSLPASVSKVLKETFKGNYNDQHPFKLLEKIKDKKEKEIKRKKVVPKRRAAQKILEKFKKAKNFIKR
jgi:hypothetical protein